LENEYKKDVYENGKDGKKVNYLPISSFKDYMESIDYKTYAIITLFSKYNNGENQFGDYECSRYIYKNNIINNQEEIEKLSKNKLNTVLRNVRKLAKMDNNLVVAINTPNGIAYCINFYVPEHGYYVLIPEKVLKFLIDTGNSDTIKTYVYLTYRCHGKEEEKVKRESIAKAIGLSPNSHSNLQTISNITTSLHNNGLITKQYKYDQIYEDGREKTIQNCYYKINSYQDFIKSVNKVESKHQIKE
jgi:hypothetical protein